MFFKCKYKQRSLSQNNSVLKFRKASNKTTSSAKYEILKNGVAEDSKFLGRYVFSVGSFRSIKKCNISCLLRLHEHAGEDTKQFQNILFLTSWHCFPSQKTATDIVDHNYDFVTFLNFGPLLQKEPYRGKCRGTQSTWQL